VKVGSDGADEIETELTEVDATFGFTEGVAT
jgi:hypothetical protein